MFLRIQFGFVSTFMSQGDESVSTRTRSGASDIGASMHPPFVVVDGFIFSEEKVLDAVRIIFAFMHDLDLSF